MDSSGAAIAIRWWTPHRTLDHIEQRTTIDARSGPDRRAIVARPARDRGSFSAESRMILPTDSKGDLWSTKITINARSRRDCGLILAQSWLRLKRNQGQFMANLEATTLPNRNRSHNASNPLPRPRQLPTIFGPKSSLKIDVFLSCSSTFDRFVKGIKRILM